MSSPAFTDVSFGVSLGEDLDLLGQPVSAPLGVTRFLIGILE